MKLQRIVGLSGTHGTGKSTIINGVAELGYKVNQAQLARAAQKALGWETLSLAQESKENMWALQDAILEAMFDRDQEALSTGDIVLVERTPADMWAYAEMWCRRLNIDPVTNPSAIRYKHYCRDLAKNYCRFLIVPSTEAVKFVAEPNRADLESRQFVELAINEFIESGNLPATVIKATGIVARINEAQTAMCIEKVKQ